MTLHALSLSSPPSASTHAVGLAPVKKKRKPRRWLRTRDREHLQLLNLQLDINSLYSEIQALRVTRELLAARALQAPGTDDGSYVRTVHEYFSQLRHGYADPATGAAPPHMLTARSFLYSIFDADVAKGHLRGIALCIQMIALYTAAFGPVVHELLEARIHLNPNEDADDQLTPGRNGTVLVRARTRYATTIVPQTFAIIFPRAPPALRERLMGQPLEGNGQFDIVFDAVSHRVVRFDMEFDFLPAFAKLLPHPRDLAQLFQGALVATDCCIGDEAASSAPPLEVLDDSAANSTDEDSRSCSTSANSSPVRASSSPVRSMAIQSILNDDDECEDKF